MPSSHLGRCARCTGLISRRTMTCAVCNRSVVTHNGLPVLMTEASEGNADAVVDLAPVVGRGRWSPAELADELIKAAS